MEPVNKSANHREATVRTPIGGCSSKNDMPRESKRVRLIRDFVALLDQRLAQHYRRHLLGNEADNEDVANNYLLACLQQLESNRYSVHRMQRTSAPRFAWFLRECSDRDFLRSCRMERSSFARLVVMSENCEVFAYVHRKKKKAKVAAPLLGPSLCHVMRLGFMRLLPLEGADGSIGAEEVMSADVVAWTFGDKLAGVGLVLRGISYALVSITPMTCCRRATNSTEFEAVEN